MICQRRRGLGFRIKTWNTCRKFTKYGANREIRRGSKGLPKQRAWFSIVVDLGASSISSNASHRVPRRQDPRWLPHQHAGRPTLRLRCPSCVSSTKLESLAGCPSVLALSFIGNMNPKMSENSHRCSFGYAAVNVSWAFLGTEMSPSFLFSC